eukprot:207915-Chlamydomonas_euryale.AAC.4
MLGALLTGHFESHASRFAQTLAAGGQCAAKFRKSHMRTPGPHTSVAGLQAPVDASEEAGPHIAEPGLYTAEPGPPASQPGPYSSSVRT